MVRKRSRKYESDNDSDSDVDFDIEKESKPAPKKYSLRERSRPASFTAITYDYYGLDDEEEGAKQSSDEDFEVQGNEVKPYFEPDANADPRNAEGLIDFEDIIRADIVVNKNKIDYDNVIQKSEITLTEKKKRGRKPKKQIEDSVNEEIVTEPDTNIFEEENTDDNAVLTEDTSPANGDTLCKNDTDQPSGPPSDLGTSKLEPPKVEQIPPDEDDDVIVLEVKHDVIVLDD